MMMETNSFLLLEKGIELAYKNWKKFENDLNFKKSDFDHFICHQVGRAHQKALYQKLEFDIKKDFSTFKEYGNIGPVSLPLTLAKGMENKLIKKSESALLLGIGSGLHSFMLGVKN